MFAGGQVLSSGYAMSVCFMLTYFREISRHFLRQRYKSVKKAANAFSYIFDIFRRMVYHV